MSSPAGPTSPVERVERATRKPAWLAGWAALAVLTALVALEVTAGLDRVTFGWFTPLDHPRPVHLFWRILVMGGQFWLVGTAVLVLSAVSSGRRRSWRPLLVGLGSVVCLDLLLWSSKHLIGRTSPHSGLNEVFGAGTSYPSGHTANATVCLVLMAWLVRGQYRRVAIRAAGLVAFGVGVANLVLGYHWLTDVLAGWLLGAVVLIPAYTACSANWVSYSEA